MMIACPRRIVRRAATLSAPLGCFVLSGILGLVAMRIEASQGGKAQSGAEPPSTAEPLVFLKIGTSPVALFGTEPNRPKVHLDYLRLPTGAFATRRFPMVKDFPGETRDHPHHRGVWFAHGEVRATGAADGKPVDFWSEGPGRGRIRQRHLQPECGPAGEVIWHLDWLSPNGEVLLTEKQSWHVREVGSDWLVTFTTELQPAAGEVTFGDTKEGTFGLRLAEPLTPRRGGVLTNSLGGTGEAACWGRQADWVDVSGTVDGQEVGVAVFDDVANPYRAAWHVRSYGLLAANPFGRAKSGFPDRRGLTEVVTLPPGSTLKLRYGILLHAGKADPHRLQQAHADFCKARADQVK